MKWFDPMERFLWLLIISIIIICFAGSCTPTVSLKKTVPERTQELLLEREEHPFVVTSEGTVVGKTIDKRLTIKTVEPISKKRSLWSRWWWWTIFVGALVFIFGWAPLVFVLRKLRQRGHELWQSRHALRQVVENVQEFKKEAELDPKKDCVENLEEHLKRQDAVTRKKVVQAKESNST